MAEAIEDAFNTAWRDYVTDGVPSSGRNNPKKTEIRLAGTVLQSAINGLSSFASSGAKWAALGPVALATTGNVTLSGEQTIDGTLTSTSRVLVKGQSAPAANGLYTTGAGAWTRTTDADTAAEMLGLAVSVNGGTANGGKSFICQPVAPVTLGSTALPFAETTNHSSFTAALAAKPGFSDLYSETAQTSQWLWDEPFSARADEDFGVSDEADIEGRFLELIDVHGRHRIIRDSDPENAADGRYGESFTDASDRYLWTFGPGGDLVEPGQSFGGVTGKENDGRPFVIDETGTKFILSSEAALGDVTMSAPYLVKVAFASPSFGANEIRLFGPNGSGASIYAGPLVIYDEVDGQSLSVGSAATEAYYQMRHAYKGAALMLARVDVTDAANDARGANYALDTQTPSLLEQTALGFLPLTEKISASGYGGQTICSSFADKMFSHMEVDVGRPQVRLFAVVGVGGAAYSELDPTTVWWANKLNMLRAANRIARGSGARLIKPFKKLLHGESDHLRYSPAEQAAHTGYYADILAWQAQDNIDTKAITGQTVDVRFIFLAESQRHPLLEVASPVAMLDAMRDHPDKVIVAGPQYPIHAQGFSQTDAVHLKASGEVIAGEYLARAEYELGMRRNAAWRPLHITNVAFDGNVTLTVTLHNPAGTALVIDTATINEREGKGFNVKTDSTETAISNVVINSPTQLTITLATTPPTGTYRGLFYAGKGPATVGEADPLTNTPAGNIRNTRTETSRIPGVILHDWLCADYRPF